MQLITKANLQAIVDRINRIQGVTPSAYPNAGEYCLDWAYGGVSLHRMSPTLGCTGQNDVLSIGHVSKRELQGAMFAYIRGLTDAKGD